MPAYVRQARPMWFRVVALLLILWGGAGVAACIQQLRLGADAMGPADDYYRALYASLPLWYNAVYAVAVGAGMLGSVALLAGRAIARPLYIVSLAAVVIQFGWLFLTADMVAVRGFAATAGFPIVIVAIAAFQVWVAGHARRQGWTR